jgi:hypothetical protein
MRGIRQGPKRAKTTPNIPVENGTSQAAKRPLQMYASSVLELYSGVASLLTVISIISSQ